MGRNPGDNKWAIATVSLGKHPSHTLVRKLKAAARYGFQGVELVHSDLLNHAKTSGLSPVKGAEQIRAMCRDLGIQILSLNPLKNIEGNLDVTLSKRLDTAREWIELAVAAGSKIIQMPSQFLAHSTGDYEVIIPELQALADLANENHISIVYEAVAFARSNSLWQDSLRVVEAVNRSNFGLCLDSFHIHAHIWGDRYANDGKFSHGDEVLRDPMRVCPAVPPRKGALCTVLRCGEN